MSTVVIVGAGISGLAIAFRLHQADPALELVVLEQRARPGGTVWTERQDGYQVEIGPNGFLDNNPSTLALCRDLGLAGRLVPASEGAARNRYLYWKGSLRPLPNSLASFLTSPLLSWPGKIGLLAERFRSVPRPIDEESVEAFVHRRAGKEVAEVFADALVTGIYAGNPALLSVRAAFPRLTAFEEQYGSVLKGFGRAARRRRQEAVARGEPYQPPRMRSFREGLRVLIETLCERLPHPPRYTAGVRRLERANRHGERPGWLVVGEGRERWSADAVVLACPAYQQAEILADIDGELAARIGGIPYNRLAVVALGYRRADVPGDLTGFGYIAPQRTRRDLLGVQWCSSIFPQRAGPGNVLLRTMCGGWQRPEIVGWDDDRLLAAVRQELRQTMRIEAPPSFQHIIRWDRAIPQYHLGHLARVAWIEDRVTRHPGVFLAGNAYHGVALNDCSEQAWVMAGRIRAYLAQLPNQ
jgi:oxygen-dependent protoporphyrinogen oxidase